MVIDDKKLYSQYEKEYQEEQRKSDIWWRVREDARIKRHEMEMDSIKNDLINRYGMPYKKNSILCKMGIHKNYGHNYHISGGFTGFYGYCIRCGIRQEDP